MATLLHIKNGSAGITALKIVNNKLFALGGFDSICNKPAQSIAVYQNNQWLAFSNNSPLPFYQNGDFILAVEYYKGEYYFGGNINTNTNFSEILRYDGTNWKDLNGGIYGGLADVRGLVVYKDILYVIGQFLKMKITSLIL